MKVKHRTLDRLKKLRELELEAWAKQSYKDQGLRNILVIDDCPKTTNLIYQYLAKDSMLKISLFNDEFDALKHISFDKPDLIIIDVYLSTLDGFKLSRMMDGLSTIKIPILFMSAKNKKDSKIRINLESEDSFIQKPFIKDKLIDQVYKKLNQFAA